MIEAELKAKLRNPDAVTRQLGQLATAEPATYRDTYYDSRDARLETSGHELRVRTITTTNGERTVLTFKDQAVDEASGSKPEFEVTVDSAPQLAAIIERLGYLSTITFAKQCLNYRFTAGGREFLATVVTVPAELDDTFLEVETMTEDVGDLAAALAAVRLVLADLGVGEDQLTTQLYTDAVPARRYRIP